ncbi:MAG: aminodeoxychorismate lyase, partial [Pseudomonadota bacterium]|nr:aminodeoxychorismate lyase [Pseudomonadota bacterium]
MKFWRVLIVGVVLICAGLAASTLWWLNRPLPLAADTVEVSIEFGTAPRDIAQAWVQAGVEASPLLLYEWFRWSGEA